MLPSTNKTQNYYKHSRWRSKISVLVPSLSTLCSLLCQQMLLPRIFQHILHGPTGTTYFCHCKQTIKSTRGAQLLGDTPFFSYIGVSVCVSAFDQSKNYRYSPTPYLKVNFVEKTTLRAKFIPMIVKFSFKKIEKNHSYPRWEVGGNAVTVKHS